MTINDRVYWTDPDGGASSGEYTVTAIRAAVDAPPPDTVVVIANESGTEAEVPFHELAVVVRDERYWGTKIAQMLSDAGAVTINLSDPQVSAAADATEAARREMIATNQAAADLAENADQTWDTEALRRDFEVLGFMAPFVVVRRKSDGAKGSLEFTHSPRVYFGWRAD